MFDNQNTQIKLSWQDKFGKNLSYYFGDSKILGIRVNDEGFNYMNWKKFFYGLARPLSNLKIEMEQKKLIYEDFTPQIKMIVPRPVSRFAERLSVIEVLDILQTISETETLVDHPMITVHRNERWITLPLHKKIILHMLAGVDIRYKFHIIFLERIHLQGKQSQQLYEALKFITTKLGLCVCVLGDPASIPGIHWVPLLSPPVVNPKMLDDLSENEDSDEDVA